MHRFNNFPLQLTNENRLAQPIWSIILAELDQKLLFDEALDKWTHLDSPFIALVVSLSKQYNEITTEMFDVWKAPPVAEI